MTECEALKLALEALETGLCYVENEDFDNKQKFRGYEHLMPTDAAESIQEIKTAITAIKEALREHAMYEVQRLGQEIQPEQEPVAWMDDEGERVVTSKQKAGMHESLQASFPNALGRLSPQRQPLTDEQWQAQKRPQNCGTTYCSCIECVMEPPTALQENTNEY